MNVNLYYFSGTGNSLYIAKTIKEEIEKIENKEVNIYKVAILPIQKYVNSENIQDSSDMVGIIYPTYFLDAPNVVKEFASRLELKQDCYLFLYANYGETLGNALHNMNKILTPSKVKGNYEVALPDNSIIFETKKEEIPKMLRTGEEIIKAQAKQIIQQEITPKSPYSFKYQVVSLGMKPLARKGLGFAKMKVDTTSCSGCGLCEKICPMNNIHMEEDKAGVKAPAFEKKCESCFSCLHYCPNESIRYQRMNKKKVDFQYKHPKIRVSEMVEAQKK